MTLTLRLTCTLLGLTLGPSLAAANVGAPPPGTKVASGRHFDIYVALKSESPAPADYTSRVYSVVIVAHTHKHGVQRFTKRYETLDANLLEAASWEVKDLDGDGFDEFRYLAQKTKNGCQVWPAERWEAERERFTLGGPALARFIDARGKPAPSCILR